LKSPAHPPAAIIMKQLDVNEYMALVGRQARASSRGMARAGTAQKNRALLHIAAAVRRDAPKLKEINARDVERARANGQDAAFIDRLTLTDRAIETMAAGLAADCLHVVGNVHRVPSVSVIFIA
jgi:glutamate-5-semialdehyde dehydrogenase